MEDESIQDLLDVFFNEHNIDADTGEDFLNSILNQGIDLSAYTPDEIMDALEYALQEYNDPTAITDVNHDVAFKAQQAMPHNVQDDIDYYERRLKAANDDIDYYTKELRRGNISDTYRNNCKSSLQSAIKKSTECAEKIKTLYSKNK